MLTIGCLVHLRAFRSCLKAFSHPARSLVQSWRLFQVIALSCGALLATQFFGHLAFVLFRSAVSRISSGAFWSMKKPSPNPAIDPVRFALWTLRDKAAQRRSSLR
jgi:hypothetical protein